MRSPLSDTSAQNMPEIQGVQHQRARLEKPHLLVKSQGFERRDRDPKEPDLAMFVPVPVQQSHGHFSNFLSAANQVPALC